MVNRLIAALLLPLAVTSCGRTLRSCGAYIVVLGPTALTITCPPPGFKGTETTPIGDSVTVQDNVDVAPPPPKRKPRRP